MEVKLGKVLGRKLELGIDLGWGGLVDGFGFNFGWHVVTDRSRPMSCLTLFNLIRIWAFQAPLLDSFG